MVLGLKVCTAVDAKVKFFKDEEVLGTFAPRRETQMVETDWVQTPEGMFVGLGGSKACKIYFADADGIVHLQFDSKVKLSGSW